MEDHSLFNFLSPGALGDTSIDLRLTARELAAIQYVLGTAANSGVIEAVGVGAQVAGVGPRWSLAFESGQWRIGFALARAFRPEAAGEFSARLAQVDQELSALNNAEGV